MAAAAGHTCVDAPPAGQQRHGARRRQQRLHLAPPQLGRRSGRDLALLPLLPLACGRLAAGAGAGSAAALLLPLLLLLLLLLPLLLRLQQLHHLQQGGGC